MLDLLDIHSEASSLFSEENLNEIEEAFFRYLFRNCKDKILLFFQLEDISNEDFFIEELLEDYGQLYIAFSDLATSSCSYVLECDFNFIEIFENVFVLFKNSPNLRSKDILELLE